jgi:methylmalonyl-CoA/ethylmalonyl-CoA epimerase
MPTLSQSRIGQIAIVCKDVARAPAFYRDILGLRCLFSAGPELSFFE